MSASDAFPKSELNACLTALVNTLGIPSDYWERWQMETYMLAKMFSDLHGSVYPEGEQLAGLGAYQKMKGKGRECIMIQNDPKKWYEPGLASKCFDEGSIQRGRDGNAYVAGPRVWTKVNTDTRLGQAVASEAEDLMAQSGTVTDEVFSKVRAQLRQAEPANFRSSDVDNAGAMRMSSV